ncbi:hypothetical protein B9N43_00785 [Denitratisoma sp. DHT3]|uniref:LPS translocon maturation chaperone LptM n=1 Tax=Denitratisoma sp. DHT3 TaxID=1981880 RepID=UPI0011986E86|nr:lipoprotein [Denitratisoma sp. DHT3]QDX79914.1 hypothetical protein B9N43_00785 [Denitratisoma sp. DHT3]
MHRFLICLVALLAPLLILAACGTKGQLYLPKPAASATPAAAAKPSQPAPDHNIAPGPAQESVR